METSVIPVFLRNPAPQGPRWQIPVPTTGEISEISESSESSGGGGGGISFIKQYDNNKYNNRKRLYEHYAGMFPTFEMFCSTMDQCTNNYECLVIHNSSRSNKLEEQVFWYKAGSHENFKTCTPEAWVYSQQNYVEEDEEFNENNNTKWQKINDRVYYKL